MFEKSNDNNKAEIEEILEGVPTDKINKEVAESELKRMFNFFGLDSEDEEHSKTKGRMIKAFQDGRMEFDIDSEKVSIKLIKPITLENGETINKLTLIEPTANQLLAVDKYDDRENMAKAVAMTAKITGLPDSTIKKLKSRDLTTVTAVVVLFF